MTSPERSKRLLYFSPTTSGGLADYAREQANALGRLEWKRICFHPSFSCPASGTFNLRPD